MKKGVVFILGVAVGVVLAMVAVGVIYRAEQVKLVKEDLERTVEEMNATLAEEDQMFDEPGEVLKEAGFRVFDCVKDGYALANGLTRDRSGVTHANNMTVLLYNKEGKPYYEQQEVSLDKGQVFRVVGVYRYHSNRDHTVPIVMAMEE